MSEGEEVEEPLATRMLTSSPFSFEPRLMHQLNFEQNRQQTIRELKSKIAISNDTSLPLLVKTVADDYDRIIAMSIQRLLPLHKTHIF